ncbi:MAG: sporulation protein YunB [Bacillota bacterium]|jgi:sporulation protein YunB
MRRRWQPKMPRFRWHRGVSPRVTIAVLSVLAVIFGGIWLLDRNLQPTLMAIAEARAKVIATQAINDAISTRIAQDIKYGLLITVHTDYNGKPAWAQVNTMEVNRLVAATTMRVQESLTAIRGEVLRIPLGQALNSYLLANFGPRIPFTIVPVGTVNVEVTDAFEEAGINQTRHKIYLEVYSEVQIVIPFVTKSVQVHSRVPIADVTYMGEVPQTVIDLPYPLGSSQNLPGGGERPPGSVGP